MAKEKTTPRQIAKDFLDMFLTVSNVHAENRKFRFRMFFDERPPGCVKAFALHSPVAEKIDQNNFAFKFRSGYRLPVDIRPFDGRKRRTDFQVTVESDLFWLAPGEYDQHQQGCGDTFHGSKSFASGESGTCRSSIFAPTMIPTAAARNAAPISDQATIQKLRFEDMVGL